MGAQLAKGEYFFIVDSDDALVDTSIETIIKWFDTVRMEDGFGGLAGLKAYSADKIVGKTFDGEYVDATSLERDNYNIKGDKAEVFYTEVIKKYPFPEFNGEKFVPEALVYNRIASAGYKLRWFNEIVYITEYQADGYSANVDKLLIKNWKGYSLYVKEVVTSTMPLKSRVLIGGAWCLRGVKRLCRKY